MSDINPRIVPIKFYFDVISPYAWLAWKSLTQECNLTYKDIQPIPVLFAGLLNHYGHLGPAEIPPKRLWLVKDVARRATVKGYTFTTPPSHPFNPLLALRVASSDMSHEQRHSLVGLLLDAVWSQGQNVSDPDVVINICRSNGLDGTEVVSKALKDDSVKISLRNQTEDAISKGVFGVPTCMVGTELFWGSENETLQFVLSAHKGKNIIKLDDNLIKKWMDTKSSATRRRS
jgi:2-hydroxychromene-2-carboxylate isomerase